MKEDRYPTTSPLNNLLLECPGSASSGFDDVYAPRLFAQDPGYEGVRHGWGGDYGYTCFLLGGEESIVIVISLYVGRVGGMYQDRGMGAGGL